MLRSANLGVAEVASKEVVIVEAEFDINGNFKVLRVAKGLGFGLDEQTLEVFKTYRFVPAYRSGRRSRCHREH